LASGPDRAAGRWLRRGDLDRTRGRAWRFASGAVRRDETASEAFDRENVASVAYLRAIAGRLGGVAIKWISCSSSPASNQITGFSCSPIGLAPRRDPHARML
jgi:hypothetical protein